MDPNLHARACVASLLFGTLKRASSQLPRPPARIGGASTSIPRTSTSGCLATLSYRRLISSFTSCVFSFFVLSPQRAPFIISLPPPPPSLSLFLDLDLASLFTLILCIAKQPTLLTTPHEELLTIQLTLRLILLNPFFTPETTPPELFSLPPLLLCTNNGGLGRPLIEPTHANDALPPPHVETEARMSLLARTNSSTSSSPARRPGPSIISLADHRRAVDRGGRSFRNRSRSSVCNFFFPAELPVPSGGAGFTCEPFQEADDGSSSSTAQFAPPPLTTFLTHPVWTSLSFQSSVQAHPLAPKS